MGRRGFESRLFTCQKLIQRDESQTVVLDVDMLSALAAGLIRCIHIDGFYQFIKDIRGKLLNADMLACLAIVWVCYLVYFLLFVNTIRAA